MPLGNVMRNSLLERGHLHEHIVIAVPIPPLPPNAVRNRLGDDCRPEHRVLDLAPLAQLRVEISVEIRVHDLDHSTALVEEQDIAQLVAMHANQQIGLEHQRCLVLVGGI